MGFPCRKGPPCALFHAPAGLGVCIWLAIAYVEIARGTNELCSNMAMPFASKKKVKEAPRRQKSETKPRTSTSCEMAMPFAKKEKAKKDSKTDASESKGYARKSSSAAGPPAS